MPGPVLLQSGYLEIGCCSNGDFVAVDCVREPAAVVYVSHEEFDYDDPEGVPRITRRVAGSVAEYLLALNREEAPLSYWDD